MYQENQGYPDNSGEVIVKRKRGRPRKYPKPDPVLGENAFGLKSQKLYIAENAHAPPGFERVNGKQTCQVYASNNANDVVVGQKVYGVVEATFDAGYLLTVTLGNSETALRGVVFKPGNYVPVSEANDLVPDIQMIRRNEVPFQRGKTKQHLNASQSGSANSYNELPKPNQVPCGASNVSKLDPRKCKRVPIVAYQTGISVQGNVVPPALQPDNPQAVLTSVNQAAAGRSVGIVAANGKQTSETSHTLNGTVLGKTTFTSGNQMTQTLPHNSELAVCRSTPNLAGPGNQTPAQVLPDPEANATKRHGRPFEKLLSEVIKSIQPPLESAQAAETCRLNVKGSSHKLEDDEEPLTIEPLRSIEPNESAFMYKPVEDYRTGKMTHLLQAVQENMKENKGSFD